MKKHSFIEHLESIRRCLYRDNGYKTDDQNSVMLAYERWMNDRPLMLGEESECGNECFIGYRGYWSVDRNGCAIHREKNRELAERHKQEESRKEKEKSEPAKGWLKNFRK
jgi:hypothetical protein